LSKLRTLHIINYKFYLSFILEVPQGQQPWEAQQYQAQCV